MEGEDKEEAKYEGKEEAHLGDYHWRRGLGFGRNGAGEKL